MTRIAVTAASGQLGSAIVQAAVKIVGKEKVVGLARTPSKAESLDVQVRPGDYTSRSELTASLQDIDSLLLVSGMDAPDKRIDQHRNVIEAAGARGEQSVREAVMDYLRENG